jgi:hypothetical protein
MYGSHVEVEFYVFPDGLYGKRKGFDWLFISSKKIMLWSPLVSALVWLLGVRLFQSFSGFNLILVFSCIMILCQRAWSKCNAAVSAASELLYFSVVGTLIRDCMLWPTSHDWLYSSKNVKNGCLDVHFMIKCQELLHHLNI